MNQRSLEIGRKMLANGMDEASVMDMTGLTAEEIKAHPINQGGLSI